jgi:hypothetical protein
MAEMATAGNPRPRPLRSKSPCIVSIHPPGGAGDGSCASPHQGVGPEPGAPGKNATDNLQIRAAWAARAKDLAAWAWANLVNRTDVWGGYLPLYRRTAQKKILTAPAKSQRGKVLLTPSVLIRHCRGCDPGDVIGLHSTGADNTSRWGAVDIDWHGESSADPAANLNAALGWYRRLKTLGLCPLLVSSNGQGGYHLWTLFEQPAATRDVFGLLKWLVGDHVSHSLAEAPETFPKQSQLAPGRFGNWLRLPGRHHTRDYRSEVWDDGRWLAGAEAVAHILSLRGSPPNRIPADARVHATPRPAPAQPTAAAQRPPSDDRLADRVSAYMGRLPHLSEGHGRDDVAYQFACFLVRDLSLSDDDALDWLCRWDDGNSPPKGQDRLREIIGSAHAYGQRPYGSGLGEPPRPARRQKRTSRIRFTVRL